MGLFIVAPIPRPPLLSEKTYRVIEPNGQTSTEKQLPCWQEKFDAQREAARAKRNPSDNETKAEDPEVFMSLVVPAFNEEERLSVMLAEATDFLQREYGSQLPSIEANGNRAKRKSGKHEMSNSHVSPRTTSCRGWEVLVVSDGSTDRTIDTALDFARNLGGNAASCIRVVQLHENRGKGGAVTHGMRHVRGQYAIFADADGASRFEDLGKLVEASKKIEDTQGRGVAVGSRAHLVGSEAVVKACSLSYRRSSFANG